MSPISNMTEISAEFDKLENTPKDLLKYLKNVLEGNVDEPLGRAMGKPNWRCTLQTIDTRFARMSKATGLLPEEICRKSGFHPNDTDLGRIDAFFAEFRFAAWLVGMGFHDIERVPRSSTRQPDFRAKRGQHCYYAEVFCIPTDNPSAGRIEPALVLSNGEVVYNITEINKHLHDKFLERAQDKKCQPMNVGSADSLRIMAGVVNPLLYNTFQQETDYRNILQSIHDALNWGTGWHFVLITGYDSKYDSNGIPDDTVYPPLEDNM